MNENMLELREELAGLEHERWSRWMTYMFSQGFLNDDGSWTMPSDKVLRWSKQATTKYASLTEVEKDSDRKEVDKILEVINRNNAIIRIQEHD